MRTKQKSSPKRLEKFPPKIHRHILYCCLPKKNFRESYGVHVDQYRREIAGTKKMSAWKTLYWFACTQAGEFTGMLKDLPRDFIVQLVIAILVATII